MAVEIPVFIDIDKAFEDAAKKLPDAIRPLQQFLESNSNALAIRLKIDDNSKLALKQILEDATLSAKNFKTALQDAYAWLEKRGAEGGLDLSKGLTESERIHLQALGALEYKVNGVADASRMMGVVYAANIDRAKAKIVELTASLDELTIKQNKNYKLGKDHSLQIRGDGKNYEKTKARISEVNLELDLTRKKLVSLEAELANISGGATRAAASIGKMETPAMRMAEEFRRGATYVERWQASLAGANSQLGLLIKSSLSLIALHSATSFIRNVRQVTAEFEMQRVALGGIIQDTERAEALFKQIKAAAIRSPFEIKDLVSFTKQLSAYRIETENLFDVTMRLADISAGLGVDMSRLVLAYGQVRAAAVLRGQELRQFTEAGIPLVELLAEKFRELGREGTTTADVFELISKRAVPFSMIKEIFEDMTNAGGIFYKMQEKQSETLKGQWMKLRDALSIMYDEIGNTEVVHGAMEKLLKDAMGLLQNWREVARTVKTVTIAFIAYKLAMANARVAAHALTLQEAASVSALQLNTVARSRLIASLFGETAATKVQLLVGNAYVRMKKREMIATNLFSKSLYRLAAALLANPYAAAMVGATALVLLFSKLARNSREAAFSIDQFTKSTEELGKANSHVRDIAALCSEYERLINISKRSGEEQERLARVTKELAAAYPSAVKGANAYGDAVEIDVRKVRELTEQERELIKVTLERQKAQAEAELDSLRRRRDQINDSYKTGFKIEGTDIDPTAEYRDFTEEELGKMGEELAGIISKIAELTKKISEADDALKDFRDELIGPAIPDFFGDAWRLRFDEYKTMLTTAKTETKAFTHLQIEQFDSVVSAVDAAAKAYQEQTKLVQFYEKAVENASGALRLQFQGALDDAKLMQAMYAQILTDFNAWYLIDKKSSSSGSDPFIQKMQDRMKFMQDFRKGYEDLNKYVSSVDALSKVSEKMNARGLSLGIEIPEQTRAVTDFVAWYEDSMKEMFERAKKYGASGTIESFLSQSINEASKRGKVLKDFQKALQALFDAKTDLDVSELKKNLEKKIREVSEQIKRSETVRSFYQNILDMTGSEELAATLAQNIYGDVGKEFKERIQDGLDAAFASINVDGLSEDVLPKIKKAISEQDFGTILDNLSLFPEEWQKILKQMAADNEKYDASWISNIIKTYQKTKSYEERITEIRKREEKNRDRIAKSKIFDDAQKESLIQASRTKEAKDVAAVEVEALKSTYEWTKAFEDLDRVGNVTLSNLREKILRFIDANKDNLTPEQLKALREELEKIYSIQAQRNPFDAIMSGGRRMLLIRNALSQTEGTPGFDEAIKKIKEYNKAVGETEQIDITHLGDAFADANVELEKGIDGVRAYVDAWRSAVDAITEAFNLDDVPVLGETLDGISDALSFVAGILPVIITLNQILNGVLMVNPIIAAGAAIVATVGAIVGLVKGIVNARVERLNKKIEKQEKLLKDLEKTYKRLEDAMAEAFGTEYVARFEQALAVLSAKEKAYMKQAELERDKGKKKDKDKIEDYKDKAEEAAQELAKMRKEASSFFAGQDLASAAEAFSDAWLDAYAEFGDTAGAIEERMTEMVQTLVKKAALSGIAQQVLGDWYASLANVQDWNAQTIAAKWKEAMALVTPMVNGMQTFSAALQREGVSLRAAAGSFTGIARDVAGASEESINGLTTGINTQNFYISHIDQSVSRVLSILSGGTSGENTEDVVSMDPYKKQMLELVGNLPQMRDDMSSIRSLLEKVIKPVGTTSSHRVIIG